MLRDFNIIRSMAICEYQHQPQRYQLKETLDQTMFHRNEDALKNANNIGAESKFKSS